MGILDGDVRVVARVLLLLLLLLLGLDEDTAEWNDRVRRGYSALLVARSLALRSFIPSVFGWTADHTLGCDIVIVLLDVVFVFVVVVVVVVVVW